MEQARSTISKIFNGEPHSYTRFNLTQNMEGDNSHVEMKLSSDMDEEAGGNGVGDHLNHKSNRKPYMAQSAGRMPKNLYFMAAMALLIFVIGVLIGYLVQSKKEVAPGCEVTAKLEEEIIQHETGAAPLMDWDKVKKLLAQKLSTDDFETTFGDFDRPSHRAGSKDDEDLGEKVHKRFLTYGMKTWTDEHYVKVQDPPASGYNRFIYKNQNEGHPQGFLAYSATGNVTGAVLYASYGQEAEFGLLQDKSINLTGRVMLVRAGKISFAEKVANAAKVGAAAVLIYPDPDDYTFGLTTELFGHVHLGSGDPYTPSFPSFNHTQFPPVQSSGLPNILAQTISTQMATNILRQLGGESLPSSWSGANRLGDESDVITLEVSNVLVEKKIHNVFGVIKGFVDSDRYVVIGAKRDAWGPGFAGSTVGTSVLVELARAITDMVKNDGFKPRRSIVFASWSAGEYGSVGATEWLEGYLSSLSMKAFAYIDLDGVVQGRNGFKVAGSPLMHSLIKNALDEVDSPNIGQTLAAQFAKGNWEATIEDMKMDSASYPFLAFSGIPSVSFRFTPGNMEYKYFGTTEDTRAWLNTATSNQVPQMAQVAAKFAGHIALRLVHDHLLRMDVMKYSKIISKQVALINGKVKDIKRMQVQGIPQALTMQWLMSAAGSYSRAARSLATSIDNSDLDDIEMCRIINDRIMTVERNFLSPYVSPKSTPFRHILLGSGPHSLMGLLDHLDAFKKSRPEADAELFRNQFALATWTIQGCANSLAGDIWSLDNQI